MLTVQVLLGAWRDDDGVNGKGLGFRVSAHLPILVYALGRRDEQVSDDKQHVSSVPAATTCSPLCRVAEQIGLMNVSRAQRSGRMR